jgi:hypothetical protein
MRLLALSFVLAGRLTDHLATSSLETGTAPDRLVVWIPQITTKPFSKLKTRRNQK